jgi:hypothetical protein
MIATGTPGAQSDDDVDKGADCEDVVGSDATSSYSAGDCSLPLEEDRTRLLSSETCGVFVGGAGAIGLLSGTMSEPYENESWLLEMTDGPALDSGLLSGLRFFEEEQHLLQQEIVLRAQTTSSRMMTMAASKMKTTNAACASIAMVLSSCGPMSGTYATGLCFFSAKKRLIMSGISLTGMSGPYVRKRDSGLSIVD